MFTKKTRVLSAIVMVCMLLSLLAGIAVPVAAEDNYDEIQAVSGLKNVASLPDIKEGLASGTEYKVTDREGMNMIATLVASNTLAGYTITMANDIDMSGAPFVGIGATASGTVTSTENVDNYTFRGTFDGNGFVLKNVYVSQTTAYGVGVFSNCYGATIKNVGIAGGLVVGAGYVGGLVGIAHGNTKVLNCWNAATVIGGANSAVGGLIGVVLDGKGSLENSYNLGLLYNYINSAAGLVGQVRGDDAASFAVKNCYSAGTIVDGLTGFSNTSVDYFGAILRPANADAPTATASSDNYYLDTIGKPGWEKGGAVSSVVNDGAASFKASELPTLHTKLNNNISSDSESYTVEYAYSEAGFPVLTYKVGGSVVAKRLPAADAKNVMGNDWQNESALFATISSKAQKGLTLSSVTIENANDLFVLGILTSFHNSNSNYGLSSVMIAADIDMQDLTLADVDYYIPLACNGSAKFNIDGQGHTIKNWSSYAYLTTCYVASGGFISILNGGTLSNLSLEDAYSAYDLYYNAVSTPGYSYPALLVERVRDAESTVADCSATGRIEIVAKDAANDNNNAGLIGRFWGNVCNMRNSWCQVTTVHTYENPARTPSFSRAIGSANTVPTPSKFSNNYWFTTEGYDEPYHTGSSDNKIIGTDVQTQLTAEQGHSEEIAVALNNASSAALWTIKTVGGAKRLCRAADESETLVTLSVQRWIPTPAGFITEALPYGEPTISYHMRGAEYMPEILEGYEFDNEQEVPVILDEDMTINYYMVEPDYAYVDAAEELLAQYNPDLYGEDGAEIFANLEVALEKVEEASGLSADKQVAAIYEVMLYYDAANAYMQGGNMKAEYPNLPGISEYETYKNAGITDWAIKTKADWLYVANDMDPSTASVLRLHLTNDIDMENENVMPVAYGVGFNGLIDGHGYSFYNFNMTQVDNQNLGNTTLGDEVSWGLVSYLNSAGIIQNLGLATGKLDISNIGSQEQGVGGFAGVAHASSKIINCWNGLDIHATNKNSPSRVGGIVGRGYCTLYGCYNWGTVTGNNAYTHGLNAYAQNGTGKFYNCYSLPSQDVNKGSTSAIGQGGSYVSNATATISCYQNSWSVANYLIYNTESLANKAAEQYSKAHTLTWDQYESGYLAYTMNGGLYIMAGVDPVYWTLNEDGQTVHGTAANAVHKLEITISGEGVTPETIVSYVNGDAEVALDLGEYEVIGTEIARGDATLRGNKLIMAGSDVVIALEVACGHKGSTTYTQNPDGTHDWECSACHKGGTAVKCVKVGAWQNDATAGKHSASCECGRVLSEDCLYMNMVAVEGQEHHLRYCECGDSVEEACTMRYEEVGSNAHRHYCISCGKSEQSNCAYGELVKTKAPTYTEFGSETKSCICGRSVSYPIAKLTGGTIAVSAPTGYAGEKLTVDLNMQGITEGNSTFRTLKVTITYDATYLKYRQYGFSYSGDPVNCNIATGTNSVTITLQDVRQLNKKLGELYFDVLKDAPEGKALITVDVVESSIELSDTFALVDIWEYAWGDANGDKRTTIADVVVMLRVINGESDVVYTKAACDVWNDRFQSEGSDNKITASDAVLILRYVMGEYAPQL